MDNYIFKETSIKDTYVIESKTFEDNRGSFIKSFEREQFENAGIVFNCDEDFITSSTKYVIRGLHFQLYKPQIKLVGVIRGKVFDVVVDLRKDSKTYGKWEGFYLSSNNRNSLLIPRGCAHGFMSLSEDSILSYKCDGLYDRKSDTGIYYADTDLNIDWPIPLGTPVIIGARDKKLMSFKEFDQNCKFDF